MKWENCDGCFNWNAKLRRWNSSEDSALREQRERWDQLNLHALKDLTYGQFVCNKVKDVFPWLADNLNPEAVPPGES